MDIGLLYPTYSTEAYAIDPETLADWAVAAEDAGFATLWAIEHFVKPPTYRTSWLDPFVSLGHAAALTTDIGLGTSVLALPQRRTAKAAHGFATLSHLLGERPLTVGVGAGYVEREFEAVGVPHDERGPRLTEAVDVLERLLEGPASVDGEFHEFEDVRVDPVPEDPPAFLAAGDSAVVDGERRMTRPVLDRIVDVGGWIAAPEQPAGAAQELSLITDHAEHEGVDPDSLSTALLNYLYLPDPDDADPVATQRGVYGDFVDTRGGRGLEYVDDHYLLGSADDVRAQLREYERLGFDELILSPPALPAGDAGDYRTQLERMADLLPVTDG